MSQMKHLTILFIFLVFCVACSKEADDIQAHGHAHFVEQAQLKIQQQQYQHALNDMETAISLAPQQVEYHFLHCMLQERTGEPPSQTRPCYAKVVALLSNDDKPCGQNINCILADLMAESTQAETRRQEFLASPATSTELEVAHYLLAEFNRDAFLKTLLP